MNNPFSEAVFEMGWKLQAKIPFLGKWCEIAVLAEAYHEAEKAADTHIDNLGGLSNRSIDYMCDSFLECE